MRRRTVLAALGTAPVAVAGCVADDAERPGDGRTDTGTAGDTTGDSGEDGDSGEGSVRSRFEGAPRRPECERESETVEVEYGDETREFETAETTPYPEFPTEHDDASLVSYAKDFEGAYVTHDVLCDRRSSGHVLSVGYDVQASETLEWYDDVTVVFLLRAGAATAGVDGQGRVWEADLPYEGVVYAVDETGAARALFEDAHTVERDEFESQAPDPLEEGDLVAVPD